MSASAGCIRVAGERPWLDCYYAAAQPMRVRLGLSASVVKPAPVPQSPVPAPQLAYAPVAPPAPVKPAGPPPMPRSTGLLNGMFNDIKPIVRNMPMQSYALDKAGAFTVTLEDGQVWKQSAEDEVYHPARWRKPAAELLVTIAPSALHTFEMTVTGEGHGYKVHRIK
jgi:hypothetical protein